MLADRDAVKGQKLADELDARCLVLLLAMFDLKADIVITDHAASQENLTLASSRSSRRICRRLLASKRCLTSV